MADNLRARIKSESMATICVLNKDLVCKDCVQRYDDTIRLQNVTSCEAYPDVKPFSVLDGGECDEYVKE